jgi:hypothetical protein
VVQAGAARRAGQVRQDPENIFLHIKKLSYTYENFSGYENPGINGPVSRTRTTAQAVFGALVSGAFLAGMRASILVSAALLLASKARP